MSSPSSRAIWTGRILSGLVALFMFFDASIKVLKLGPAMEGTVRLGYPLGTISGWRHCDASATARSMVRFPGSTWNAGVGWSLPA
jgi:hypothetical protein